MKNLCFSGLTLLFFFSLGPLVASGEEVSPQVELETQIVETTNNQNRDLGVDFGKLHEKQINDAPDLRLMNNIGNSNPALQGPTPSPVSSGFGDEANLKVIPKVSEGKAGSAAGGSTASDPPVKKPPTLSDVPFLGRLFRNKNESSQRNELVVLVNPKVMNPAQGDE